MTPVTVIVNFHGPKFFNNNLNWALGSLRTDLKFMGITATHGTDFMESFIRDGNLQWSRLIQNWNKEAAPKGLSNVYIDTHSSKLAFGATKGNIIHSYKLTNILEKLF